MEAWAAVIFWIWVGGGQFIVAAIPFYCVARKGLSFKKGILLMWGLMIVYYFISAIFFPAFVDHFIPEMSDEVTDSNSFIAAVLLGWFPSVVVLLIALWVRSLGERRTLRLKKQRDKTLM